MLRKFSISIIRIVAMGPPEESLIWEGSSPRPNGGGKKASTELFDRPESGVYRREPYSFHVMRRPNGGRLDLP